MNQRNTLLYGAAMCCVAVILGAFGAHAFKTMLATTGRLDTYELAVRYHFFHALAMLIVGTLMNQFSSKLLYYSGFFFLLGILFFSGSLYVLCFTGEKMLGAVTPVGGVLFIVGWVLLLLGVLKK